MYKKYILKNIISILFIILSAFIQTFSIQVFMQPSKLVTGGFTGLAMLVNMIFDRVNINVPIYILLISLNLPIALLCMKEISKKFVFLSLLQIFTSSFFLKIFNFEPIFSNIFLNITIGAVIYGIQMVIALKVGGSTGGTDFIALYISNRINKTIWIYVFTFNMVVLFIFGYLFSWDNAGYSVLFQFITTKLIDKLYNRYHRITIQIISKKGEEVANEYISKYRHGMTKVIAEGAYSKEKIYLCYTVVSVYEVSDVVNTVLKIDQNAIINTFKTEHFYGKFYIPPM